ncbi:MAG: 50S ribosomal protein L4 [Gammaproteobacteria bacterium]|jgi:large subunit ribosomal protein L4|nr:50S ribosomal protein L4 [Gammaproteobacteria bacterium]
MDIRMVGSSGSVTVSDANFGCPFNEALVHQVVTAYMAGGRSGTRAQLTRAEVRGGGIKPWRQKGSGRARAGSIRSPLWRGGGTTFAAVPANYSQKVNRKMYRAAMRSILSELLRQERLLVVEDIGIKEPKTKAMVARLGELGVEGRVLLVVDEISEAVYLAARNLYGIEVIDTASVDPVSLVRFDRVVMDAAALRKVEERLA